MKKIKMFTIRGSTYYNDDEFEPALVSDTLWSEVSDEEFNELKQWIQLKAQNRNNYSRYNEHIYLVTEDTEEILKHFVSDYQKEMKKEKAKATKAKEAAEKRKATMAAKKAQKEKEQYEKLKQKFGE